MASPLSPAQARVVLRLSRAPAREAVKVTLRSLVARGLFMLGLNVGGCRMRLTGC